MAAQLASADERFVLGTPDSLFVAADGSLVFTDDQQGTDSFGRVLQIGHDGMPKVLFGDGATTATAAAMQLSQPQGILVTSDGRLIIADIFEQRIVEVSPDGVQRTLVSGIAEDEPSVLQALNRPDGMALGPREELYFVDADRVYRLEAGKLETLAGGGAETTDSGNAIDAKLVVPSGLAVDRDGNIFVSERGQAGQPGGHRVRQISPNGMITTIAGNGSPGYAGDDDLAATAQLNDPHGLALDPDGRLYIVDQGNNRIRRISTDGMIQTVIGGGTQPLSPNSMALNVKLDTPDGIAAGPDGSLYIAQKNTVIRAFVGMPKVTRDDYLVPSTDGRTLYHFDTRGKHLETIDVLTGITELTFAYDSAGQLIGITDKDQNVTKIERDTSGNATAVIGPYGQRTGFALDGSGNLASIVDALKRQTTITWDPRQLIGAVNSPKSKATTYRYDVNGRLTNTSDPTGIGETLKRSELANGWQVDVTNSANQTTGFVVQHRGETWTRTYIAADQTKSSLTDAGANLTRRAPDGTQQEVTFLAHEVFGAQVPRPYVDRVTLPSGKSIETTYTPTYHLKPSGSPIDLLDQTDAAETNGRWYESKFTRAGATMVRTSPTGRTAQITLNSLGRPSTFTAEGSPSTQWKYDAHGRPQTMTRSANNQVRTDVIGYDAGGFVARLTDPLKQEIISRRDVMGRLKELERPDGKKTSWDLDSADNVTSLTPPNSQAHLFSYYEVSKLLRDITPPAVANGGSPVRFDYDDLSDEVSELKRITRGDGRSIGFEYDALGRLSAQKLEKATLNFNYTQGHLTRINRSDGVAIDQTFDGPLWTSSKWTGSVSGTVKATYDKNFWLSSLTVNDASTVNFTYDDDGLLTAATALVGGATFARDVATGNISEIRAGNTATQQRFSGFGELSQLSTSVSGASLFEQTIVERDALGRIAHLRETVQGASHDLYYAYDLVGRLTKQTRDGIATSYGYDANGNRTTLQVDNIAPVTATYDAQDRILASGTQTYELDGHGDMRSRADGVKRMELTYDELGNLMKVVLADGSTQRIIEYVVDGLGRRVARRINGNFDKKWLYRDSLRPIAEVDAAGVFTHFVCASNSPLGGAPVAMIRGGVLYRIVQDQLGSVRLVVNTQTGEVAQRIDYDAYGRVLSETGAGFQPFGFAGGLYDAETGLVRFGARDYDAETGRWTNRDPIGFAGQQGNQYLYVEGDPINGLDPDGRWGVALGLGGDLGYCFGWCVGSWGLSGGIYIDHRSGVGVYGSGQAGMGLGAHAGLSLQLSGFNSLSAFHGNSYGLELTMPGPSGSAAGNESGGVFSGTLGVGGGLYVGPVVTHTKTYGISWAEASEAWEFAAYDASAWWSDITIAMMRAFNKYLPTSFFW
ncbi:MAG TPA: RHS repeat-associated core domain-containing protein [Polyangiaceae bacterium]